MKAENLFRSQRTLTLPQSANELEPMPHDENANSLEDIRMRRMGYVKVKNGLWVSASVLVNKNQQPKTPIKEIKSAEPSYFGNYSHEPHRDKRGHDYFESQFGHKCSPKTIRTKKSRARVRITFRGRVQCVGFRSQTIDVLDRFPDLTGFVMNMPDGSVVCQMQGKTKDIRDAYQGIFDKIRSGIESTLVKEIAWVKGEVGFYQRGSSYAKSTYTQDFRKDFRNAPLSDFDYSSKSYGGYASYNPNRYQPPRKYYDPPNETLRGLDAETSRRYNQGDFKDKQFLDRYVPPLPGMGYDGD